MAANPAPIRLAILHNVYVNMFTRRYKFPSYRRQYRFAYLQSEFSKRINILGNQIHPID